MTEAEALSALRKHHARQLHEIAEGRRVYVEPLSHVQIAGGRATLEQMTLLARMRRRGLIQWVSLEVNGVCVARGYLLTPGGYPERVRRPQGTAYTLLKKYLTICALVIYASCVLGRTNLLTSCLHDQS